MTELTIEQAIELAITKGVIEGLATAIELAEEAERFGLSFDELISGLRKIKRKQESKL